MARQLRTRWTASGITLLDVISAVAVLLILAVVSVPSHTTVTDAHMRRDGLRQVEPGIGVK